MSEEVKKERYRVTRAQLMIERERLAQFILQKIRAKEGNRLETKLIYEAYVSWVHDKFGTEVFVNRQGFGRMLPKHFRVGIYHMNMEKRSRRCALGIDLIEDRKC